MIEVVDKLKEYSAMFYGKEHVSQKITFDQLKKIATNEWLQVPGAKILGTIIGHKNLVFFGEWESKTIVDYHQHYDCQETIFIVEGTFLINDKIILSKGAKRTFYKNETHKIESLVEGQLMVQIEKIY